MGKVVAEGLGVWGQSGDWSCSQEEKSMTCKLDPKEKKWGSSHEQLGICNANFLARQHKVTCRAMFFGEKAKAKYCDICFEAHRLSCLRRLEKGLQLSKLLLLPSLWRTRLDHWFPRMTKVWEMLQRQLHWEKHVEPTCSTSDEWCCMVLLPFLIPCQTSEHAILYFANYRLIGFLIGSFYQGPTSLLK